MGTVNSVLGPVDTSDLGFTLMHEHILASPPGFYQDYPDLLGGNVVERVVDKLIQARKGGIDTIVDASTQDLGRNVNLLAEVSRRSGVNILACTGWWLETPRFLAGVSPDQLAEAFVRDLEEGISGTNIRAAILKSASDVAGVTPEQEVALRAVARAHLRTGAPIMLHSYALGRVGQEQLAVLKQEGVNPARVKLDHSNDTTDLEYLFWLLEQGCYLGLDRYPGRNVSAPTRTKVMKALIDAGYADRLCPSHDWVTVRVAAANPPIPQEERERLNPHGYLYIKKVVLPQLQDMGLSEKLLMGLCVDGPRRFFGG